MEHKCPKCGSVIYSRKNVLCGRCGERLPSELLFGTEERERAEREWANARRRDLAARNPPGGSESRGGVDISTSDSGGASD